MVQTSDFEIVKVKIRDANETDANSLASLVAERGFDYPTENFLVRERLSDLTAAGDRVIVAVYDAEIIGMILLHRTRFLHRLPDGRISALVVSEKYRGFGIGARLVEAAESVFRDWGCGRIEVSSGIKRDSAHRFYVQAGFLEAPKRFIKEF